VLAALADSSATYVLPRPPCPSSSSRANGPSISSCFDGTWWQARKLLKLNPALAALPRVAFLPRKPSAYVIRREPADFASTIEALAEVLRVLEPEAAG
jgi:DTW domain-containing protein YfiP